LRQVILILTIISLLTGCSSAGKGKSTSNDVDSSNVSDYNLTKGNFQIERADITYSERGNTDNFLMSVKFVFPDRYLVSIRSKAGIEAARIYIKGDSIFMNDRINQVYYYGKSEQVTKKWGISVSYMPVILGDLIVNSKLNNKVPECSEGVISFITNLKGNMCKYDIDCSYKKIVSSEFQAESPSQKVTLNYTKFVKTGNHKYPSIVIIGVGKDDRSIEMKIRKIAFDTDNDIRFVPGTKFDIEAL
jgi:hypothetical protein